MSRHRLTVIPKPEPETRLVLVIQDEGLKGDGSIDLACGGCDRILITGAPDERLDKMRAAVVEHYLRRGGVGVSGEHGGLVLKCPGCGAYNQAPPGPASGEQ